MLKLELRNAKPRVLALGACAAWLALPVLAQTHLAELNRKLGESVVDAIVLDSSNRLVKDLTKGDFLVYENEAPQSVHSLQVGARTGEPNWIVVLLDKGLAPDGRADVLAAWADSMQFSSHERVSVFLLESGLAAISEFTSDPDRIAAALRDPRPVEGRVDASPSDSGSDLEIDLSRRLQKAAADAGAGSGGAPLRSTLTAISGIARAFEAVEGRKTLLLVSRDFQTPDAAQRLLEDTLSLSAASGLAIYGLHWQTPLPAPATDINGREQPGLVEQLSRVRNGWLTQLCHKSGGILDGGIFDLTWERLLEEARSYYRLRYEPNDDRADGGWRRLRLLVKRPGLEVQHRAAYRASNAAWAFLNESEAALLRKSLLQPTAIGTALEILVTGRAEGRYRLLLTADVPFSSLALRGDEASGRSGLNLRLSLLGWVRSEGSGVVQKFGGPLVGGEVDPQAGSGALHFVQDLELAPGTYQVGIALEDAATRRTGWAEQQVDLPVQGQGPWLGQPVIGSPATDGVASTKILSVAGLRFYPRAIRRFHPDEELVWTVEAGELGGGSATATVFVSDEDGRRVSTVFRGLPAEGRAGGAQSRWVGRLRLDDLLAGAYYLSVELEGGSSGMPGGARLPFEVLP